MAQASKGDPALGKVKFELPRSIEDFKEEDMLLYVDPLEQYEHPLDVPYKLIKSGRMRTMRESNTDKTRGLTETKQHIDVFKGQTERLELLTNKLFM